MVGRRKTPNKAGSKNVICVSGKSSVSRHEIKTSYWMNGINWSPNVDMLAVGEEGGEEEEVEYNDAFSVAIFWYFFCMIMRVL